MIEEFKATTRQRYVPVAFDGDGSLIVRTRASGDMAALYRFDPRRRRRWASSLAAHPQVDLDGGLIYDRQQGSRRRRAVRRRASPACAWFDEDWARMAAGVDRALPGHFNMLSRGDGPNVLVFSYSDTRPGRVLRARQRPPQAGAPGGDARRHQAGGDAARKLVRYRGARRPRDSGVAHAASATRSQEPAARRVRARRPVGARRRTGHGTTSRRISRTSATPCSSRNFAAASAGAGSCYRAELEAVGPRDAGRPRRRHGLARDARAPSIPTRACIMGGSYGGYAVMMGLARDPDRWRCGVDYVGVTDIDLMFDVTWSDNADSDVHQVRRQGHDRRSRGRMRRS